MAYTVEEQNWVRRDLTVFERLPKRVRDAIREAPRNINVHELRKRASTESKMLALIGSGQAFEW